jgi:hypothetical protein
MFPVTVLVVCLPSLFVSPVFAKSIVGKDFGTSYFVLLKANLLSNTVIVLLGYIVLPFVSVKVAMMVLFILCSGVPALLLDRLLLNKMFGIESTRLKLTWNIIWRLSSSLIFAFPFAHALLRAMRN